MRHAFRARLINNNIKKDRKEDLDEKRHNEDLKLQDAFKGYGQEIEDKKNAQYTESRKKQLEYKHKEAHKAELEGQLNLVRQNSFGVLDDKKYK